MHKQLLVLSLLIIVANGAFCQPPRSPIFKHLTAEQIGVQYIIHSNWDSRGNLWASTDRGLLRYNGYTAEFIEGTPEDPDLFLEAHFFQLHPTGEDEIWITYPGVNPDLTRFNPLNREFKTYAIPDSLNYLFTKIYRDSRGDIWASTWGRGFLKFNEEEGTFKPVKLPYGDYLKTFDINIKDFVELRDGNFLITFFNEYAGWEAWPMLYNPISRRGETMDVLSMMNPKFEEIRKNFIAGALTIVHFVHEDENENVWFGSYSGLIFYDRKNGKFNRIDTEVIDGEFISRNDINARSYVRNGDEIWVLTPNSGIVSVDINTRKPELIQKVRHSEKSLDDNRIYTANQDPMGNIWVSTASGALNIYLQELQQFHLLDWDYLGLEWMDRSGQDIPLNDYKYRDSLLYMSHRGGIRTYNVYTNELGDFVWPNGFIDHPANITQEFMFLENDRMMSITHHHPYLVDLKKKKKIMEQPSAYSSRLLFPDGGPGTPLAFTQAYNEYFHVYNLNEDSTEFIPTPKVHEGVGLSTEFSFVLNDGKWLLSEELGRLIIYDPETNTYDLWCPSDPDHYFPDSTARCALYEDSWIWIGTENGFYSFDPKKSEYEKMNAQAGLRENEVVNAIYRDREGGFWIALRRELFYWNKRKRISLRFGENRGLKHGDFFPGHVWEDDLGNLYFKMVNGLLTFNRHELLQPSKDLRLSLSQFWINDSLENKGLTDQLADNKHVFDWQDNYLTFEFETNQIFPIVPHTFEYRLIGQNEKWVDNGASNKIRLLDIPYGDYELQVRARNGDSIESNIIRIPFEIKRPFWVTIWFYVVVGVLLILLVFLYIRRREKLLKKRSLILENIVKERTQEIIQQKEEIELQKNEAEKQREIVVEKQKEITDSIAYAKRIQEAILPAEQFFKNNLPNSFTIYLPKDIVAGDFYWMYELENMIYFAVADCTGHGVPGAMVSVVCNNALNRAIREFKLSDPGQILDKTREIVIEQLNDEANGHENSSEDIKDGMDISLCILNKNTKELLWSGANNPLWIFREEEVIKIKGDKQPVGMHIDPKPFTSHKTNIEEGDLLYIFSDGFIDQFGGPRGKKFMARNFQLLLEDIQNLSMEEQKKSLLEAYDDWKGDKEQLDDICIIGVKF